MLNTSKAASIVKIYNSKDTELYYKTLSGKENLGKIFGVSNIPNHNQTFVITTNNKTFFKALTAKQ